MGDPLSVSMQLRVLTWNIHKGIGGLDRRYRLDRIVSVLRAIDPDVALLQEVADHWPSAGSCVQVEDLADQTQLKHFAFSPEHRFKIGGYGNAVLSKLPIVDRTRIDLKIGWRKQRSALMACISLPSAAPHSQLFVTSLHLGLAERERREQLSRLFEIETHHSPSAPSILGGDFNDVFGTLEGRFMTEHGYQRLVPRKRSFPAILPVFCLDALFGHQVCSRQTYIARCEGDQTASDHRPLVADVELK